MLFREQGPNPRHPTTGGKPLLPPEVLLVALAQGQKDLKWSQQAVSFLGAGEGHGTELYGGRGKAVASTTGS